MPRRCTRGAIVIAGALCVALPVRAWPAGGQPSTSGAPTSKSAAPAGTESNRAAQTSTDETAQAKAALREMSAALTQARTLQFKVRSLIPMQLAGGTWVTLLGEATVARQGNDRLSVETGGDLFPFKLLYDGKTVTAFAPDKKIYAQEDAPQTIDATLERAAKRGEAAFVFGDLVSADPYAAMTRGLKSARVVGTSTVDGVETQHLAVHGEKLDWEIWIATSDRLPRLVTLTDIAEARKPTQTVRLSDWKVDASLPPDAFAFHAPADAMKVPFQSPEQRREKAAARRGPQPASGR